MEETLEKETKKVSDIEQIPAKSAKKIEAQRKIIDEMNEQVCSVGCSFYIFLPIFRKKAHKSVSTRISKSMPIVR